MSTFCEWVYRRVWCVYVRSASSSVLIVSVLLLDAHIVSVRASRKTVRLPSKTSAAGAYLCADCTVYNFSIDVVGISLTTQRLRLLRLPPWPHFRLVPTPRLSITHGLSGFCCSDWCAGLVKRRGERLVIRVSDEFADPHPEIATQNRESSERNVTRVLDILW